MIPRALQLEIAQLSLSSFADARTLTTVPTLRSSNTGNCPRLKALASWHSCIFVYSVSSAVGDGRTTVPPKRGMPCIAIKALTLAYSLMGASFSRRIISANNLLAQSNVWPGMVYPRSQHFFRIFIFTVPFARSIRPCVCGWRVFPCEKLDIFSRRFTSLTHWLTNSFPLSQ